MERQWPGPQCWGSKALPQGWQGWARGLRGAQTKVIGHHQTPRVCPLHVYTLSLCKNAHAFRKRCHPRHRLPESGSTPHPHSGICVRAHMGTHTRSSIHAHTLSHSLLVITETPLPFLKDM